LKVVGKERFCHDRSIHAEPLQASSAMSLTSGFNADRYALIVKAAPSGFDPFKETHSLPIASVLSVPAVNCVKDLATSI